MAERSPRLRRLARLVERSLAVTGLVLLVYQAGFQLTEVISPSMSPALTGDGPGGANDVVLIERLSLAVGPPPRFSVLWFQDQEGLNVAKRVVGYPGEQMRIEDGALLVDGRPVPGAPPVRYLAAGRLRPQAEGAADVTVAEDTLFVLGDNQRDSWDSRFTGGVPRARWRGRAVAVVWPPSRWRWLW